MATNNMANINVSILPNNFRGEWIENNQLQIVSDTYDMILYADTYNDGYIKFFHNYIE